METERMLNKKNYGKPQGNKKGKCTYAQQGEK